MATITPSMMQRDRKTKQKSRAITRKNRVMALFLHPAFMVENSVGTYQFHATGTRLSLDAVRV